MKKIKIFEEKILKNEVCKKFWKIEKFGEKSKNLGKNQKILKKIENFGKIENFENVRKFWFEKIDTGKIIANKFFLIKFERTTKVL